MGISRYQERYYNDMNILAKSMPRVEKLLEKLLEKELAESNLVGKMRSFEAARKFVRTLGMKNSQEWQNWINSGTMPVDIPNDPAKYYGLWEGFDDFLGVKQEKKIEFEVFDNGIVNYAKDDMVNLGLNGLAEFDKDLLSYWAWLHTTSEGKNTKNMGGTGKDFDIGDFNEKYPNSYWDLESRTWFKEAKA
mgnify:CR=1 FL=1